MAIRQTANAIRWTDFIAFPRNSIGTGYSTLPWGWKVDAVPATTGGPILAAALNQFRTGFITLANLSGSDLEVRSFSIGTDGGLVTGGLLVTLTGHTQPGIVRLGDGSYEISYVSAGAVKVGRFLPRIGEEKIVTVAASGDSPTPPILDDKKRLIIPYYSGTGWSLAVGTMNADGTWSFATSSMGITTTKKGGQLIQLPGGEYVFFYVTSANVVTALKSRRIKNDGTSDSWV